MAIVNFFDEIQDEEFKCIYYEETDEIEIIKDSKPEAFIYFENIQLLAELINSNPRLSRDLKNLLRDD